jgi:hypothetical protein
VVKKHLIYKKAEESDQEMDEDENLLKKKPKSGSKVSYLRKKTTYLQYCIQFHIVNPKNFDKEALGGLDYKLLTWTL